MYKLVRRKLVESQDLILWENISLTFRSPFTFYSSCLTEYISTTYKESQLLDPLIRFATYKEQQQQSNILSLGLTLLLKFYQIPRDQWFSWSVLSLTRSSLFFRIHTPKFDLSIMCSSFCVPLRSLFPKWDFRESYKARCWVHYELEILCYSFF